MCTFHLAREIKNNVKIKKGVKNCVCGARKNSNYFEWILVLKWPLACKKKTVQMMKRNIKRSVEEQEAAFAKPKDNFTSNIDTRRLCMCAC